LLGKYPKDVKLVIKHFPLRMHKFAEKASLAALAAARQDKFEEMTAILLKNQRKLSDSVIENSAKEAGLDMDRFKKDYKDPALKAVISTDQRVGRSVKVRGVPALFINGRLLKNRSISGMSKIVEEELKKKK